ncbi:MAG: hypothetical protein AB7D07_10360 [Desulfovibrionaceae bacterium]
MIARGAPPRKVHRFKDAFGEKEIANWTLELGWSLRYCQGDGVCFTGGHLDHETVEKLLGKKIKAEIYSAIPRWSGQD